MYRNLKNDKERIAFLETRSSAQGWYLWKEDPEIQREWWRYDLPDCALIVEEQLRTSMYPKKHLSQDVMHWYIIKDWDLPFADGVASRSLALAELKRCQKEKKDGVSM